MPKRLADVLDEFERLGKLNVRGEELRAALPETSTEGMRKQGAASSATSWTARACLARVGALADRTASIRDSRQPAA